MVAQWIMEWSGERPIGIFLTHLLEIDFGVGAHMGFAD